VSRTGRSARTIEPRSFVVRSKRPAKILVRGALLVNGYRGTGLILNQRGDSLSGVLKSGSASSLVFWRVRVIWVSLNERAMRNGNGDCIAYEGTIEDITERKRAEDALRESEERYRDLFENANDIIYANDLEANFTSINKMGELLTGYSREEVVGLCRHEDGPNSPAGLYGGGAREVDRKAFWRFG
jgi:PAS domain-containing protein